jgi:RNA polymerase-binding transcription factor
VDQSTIDQLRRRLDDDREQVVSQLVDMGVDPKTGEPNGDQFEQGFADSGQSTAEKSLVLSMAEGALDTMREIDAALDRMTQGTYGRCESCGELIDEERLDARPVARLCVTCKRRAG